MSEFTIVEAVREGLDLALDHDPRVVLLGQDIGKNGGVFRATDGLWEKFGDDRVIDTPISEAGIIGSAIGMAINGLRPIVEIQFLTFLYPGLEQLISHAARLRTRTQGSYPASIVVRIPYGGGIRAPELHCDATEIFFVHTPGLKVVVPSTPGDAKGLLLAALKDPDPVVFLEPMNIYRSIKEELSDGWAEVSIGKGRIVSPGEHITIISWGAMVQIAEEAAAKALEKNIICEIIDLRSLYPLDEDIIITSVKKTGRVVIVHEAPKTAGLAAEIIATINEKALLFLEAPVERVTSPDTPVPMFAHEDFFRPNVDRLLKAIDKVIDF